MKKSILVPILSTVLAALILFCASAGLRGVEEKNIQTTRNKLMEIVLPSGENFEEEAYTGEDTNIRSVYKAENGFVIETATYGYAGEISMMIGVSKDGYVTGLVVTDESETPGLGGRVLRDHKFLSQFLNTNGGVVIKGSDTEGTAYVDGIAGATVSSKAIARCVNSAVAYVTGADTQTGATSWGG